MPEYIQRINDLSRRLAIRRETAGFDSHYSLSARQVLCINYGNIIKRFCRLGRKLTSAVGDVTRNGDMYNVVRVLTSKTEKAIERYSPEKLVIAGGVSANSVLRREMQKLCKKHRIQLYMPQLQYCGDNAAMVGAQGYYEYLSGNTSGLKLNAIATMDIDIKITE